MTILKLLRSTLVLPLALSVGAGCSCPRPGGEVPEAEWVALDADAPPGASVEVTLDEELSDASQTTFVLSIKGFWVQEKQGPDGTLYQKVTVPGLGSHNQVGAPDLPLMRFNVAVPTTAALAKLEVRDVEYRTFSDYMIWPQPIPERDHPEGDPEQFQRDEKLYRLDRPWPEDDGLREIKVGRMLRSIPAVRAEVWPCKWNPTTRDLQVAESVRYTYRHAGRTLKFEQITKERHSLAKGRFLNWTAVAEHFAANLVFYTGDFLIIYPTTDYQDELAPFVQQKASRGFVVTQMTTADISSTCAAIRKAIQDWAASVPSWHDAYVLLVGDTDAIPFCTAPTGDPTDDLYASTIGDDLDEEVFLGRLSVDSETDAANQITKIITYETAPNLACCYDRVALWAHKEGAPGKYEGAHETVRTGSYSGVTPVFEAFYGSGTGTTNTDVSSRVSSGVGVLAYRGHGAWDRTATTWNQTNEDYGSADATGLTNLTSRSPVVWSFACTNTALDNEDAISEIWMEQLGTASVSYYGATVPSWTSQNHVLDEWMFRAVYDENLVTQSHAIERAEERMAALEGSGNAWMYLLLGDPDLQIRRENPTSLVVRIEEFYECRPPCLIRITIVDEKIQPIRDGLVGLFKPAISPVSTGRPLPVEVLVNRYADESGEVQFEISPETSGTLYYAVEDGRGNSLFGSVEVRLPER